MLTMLLMPGLIHIIQHRNSQSLKVPDCFKFSFGTVRLTSKLKQLHVYKLESKIVVY